MIFSRLLSLMFGTCIIYCLCSFPICSLHVVNRRRMKIKSQTAKSNIKSLENFDDGMHDCMSSNLFLTHAPRPSLLPRSFSSPKPFLLLYHLNLLYRLSLLFRFLPLLLLLLFILLLFFPSACLFWLPFIQNSKSKPRSMRVPSFIFHQRKLNILLAIFSLIVFPYCFAFPS